MVVQHAAHLLSAIATAVDVAVGTRQPLQDGSQCTTRNLRDDHGFRGLMMDGGNSRPEINLQQEMMFSNNIVQLFKKHKVPHPGFDHLTVDLDQNTFWIALAVLRGGYKPRSLTVEINRNFAWHDSYATVDMPQEMAFILDGCADHVGRACGGAQSIGKPVLLSLLTRSAALVEAHVTSLILPSPGNHNAPALQALCCYAGSTCAGCGSTLSACNRPSVGDSTVLVFLLSFGFRQLVFKRLKQFQTRCICCLVPCSPYLPVRTE
jgi:hypothetical protein